MRVGIVGSRRRNTDEDLQKVTEVFNKLKTEAIDEVSIVSGGATKGGDHFAEIIACLQNIPIKIYYPEWNRFGKLAGFERNTYIAMDSEILIACVHKDRKGGTEDTIRKFKRFHPRGQLILV
jgi:hypothetical protein